MKTCMSMRLVRRRPHGSLALPVTMVGVSVLAVLGPAQATRSAVACDGSGRLIGTTDSVLVEIDRQTGAAVPISGVGAQGYRGIEDLAYDPSSQTYYAVDTVTDQLVRWSDEYPIEVVVVGFVGFDFVAALTFNPTDGMLLGVDDSTDQLLSIDPETGAAYAIGPVGSNQILGLAYDAATGTLFGSDVLTDQLIAIDRATGAGTPIGPTGFGDVQALAFDLVNETLYGVDTATCQVVIIDRSTGLGVAQGELFCTYGDGLLSAIRIAGLTVVAPTEPYPSFAAFDSAGERLVLLDWIPGFNYWDRRIYASVGWRNLQGAVFEPLTGEIILGAAGVYPFVGLDVATGTLTEVGWRRGDLPPPNDTLRMAREGTTNTYYAFSSGNLYESNGPCEFGFVLRAQHLYGIDDITFHVGLNALLAVNGWNNRLIRIDPATYEAQLIGSLGFENVTGLAYASDSGTLLATSKFSLLTIDSGTGLATRLAPLGAAVSMAGLDYDPVTRKLYGWDQDSDQFVAIDATTGHVSSVGALWPGIADLAYDSLSGSLFGIAAPAYPRYWSSLVRVDPLTGASTALGLTGFPQTTGLAFDSGLNTLYGADWLTDQLVAIDPVTGIGAVLAPLDPGTAMSLAFDSNNATLYGTYGWGLHTIDVATGETTYVGDIPFDGVGALAIGTQGGTLLGVGGVPAQLLEIDATTGAATAIGTTFVPGISGLAVVPGPRGIYVDDDAPLGGDGTCWLSAFRHLQDAIRASSGGDKILVAGGLYLPDRHEYGDDPYPSFQLPSGRRLLGGYAGLARPDVPDLQNANLYETVLSGDLNGNDGPSFTNTEENSHHVVRTFVDDDGDTPVVIDGVTIAGGNSPASQIGGGIEVTGSLLLSNCELRLNQASTGGGIGVWGTATIFNCLFVRNHAQTRGGGVRVYGRADLQSCTFSQNTADTSGAGLAKSGTASTAVSNSIFWGNTVGGSSDTLAQIDPGTGGIIDVQFSCIQDGQPGDGAIPFGGAASGNIDEAPLFAAGPAGCYYLSHVATGQTSDSPCVDAGSGDAGALGLEDWTTRNDEDPDVGTVDMGYHYAITGLGILMGDADNDNDVDLDDFAQFRICLSSPAASDLRCGCCRLDFEPDNDVDLLDFARFQEAFSGPG